MRRKGFNLVFYFLVLSFLALLFFALFYGFYNAGIHERFLEHLQAGNIEGPIREMESTLRNATFLGLTFLFVSLFFIVLHAQGIIDRETKSIRKESYLQTVRALVNAIEARDAYTRGHSQHVALLMLLLYRYLPPYLKNGLDPRMLEYAGLLHDIGKIGIPEGVLNKNGPLTETEWVEMRKHPEIGIRILKPVTDLDEVLDWIGKHHERLDGAGYPRGVKSDEIPIAARIISIADTYSALTTDRPYRKGRSHIDAIVQMFAAGGSQLDRALLEIFGKIPAQETENLKRRIQSTMD